MESARGFVQSRLRFRPCKRSRRKLIREMGCHRGTFGRPGLSRGPANRADRRDAIRPEGIAQLDLRLMPLWTVELQQSEHGTSTRHNDASVEHRILEHQGGGVGCRVGIETELLPLADGRGRLPRAGLHAGEQLFHVGFLGELVRS